MNITDGNTCRLRMSLSIPHKLCSYVSLSYEAIFSSISFVCIVATILVITKHDLKHMNSCLCPYIEILH